MAHTKMPYGKYKNTPFSELDWGYLGWIIDHYKPETEIYQSAQQEILRRMDMQMPHTASTGSIMDLKEFLKSRE